MQFKRARWKSGSVYGVPLAGDGYGICQAIENMLPNAVYIAVFSYHFEKAPANLPPLDKRDILSLGATWKQQLNNGTWLHLGVSEPVVRKIEFPNEKYAANGYVGAQHSDAGLYSKFLSACFGLIPWNGMFREDFWEDYLNARHPRPSGIWLLDSEEREKYLAAAANRTTD